MLLYVAFGAMTAAVVALLVVPLLRRPPGAASRVAYDLEIYRDQLSELDRDLARGLIGREEADAARIEIERRMLAAAEGEKVQKSGGRRIHSFVAAAAIIVLVPLAAGGLYLWQGSPGLESKPYAEREAERAAAQAAREQAASIEQMVVRLAKRLERQPDDLRGWLLLARSYRALERYDDSVSALERAAKISNDDPSIIALLGEARVFAAQGVVTPAARKDFETALAADASEPAARFYLALAKAQAGDVRSALEDWVALERDSPPEASYLPSLRARINETARALGIDIATLRPPEESTGKKPKDLSAEEQRQMIRDMVDRLAERLKNEPDDLKGWLRLGRSYRVLGEREKAREAFAQAVKLAPDDVEVLQRYVVAIVEAAPDGAPLTDEAIQVAERLAALDDKNQQALWLLGRAAAEKGDIKRAREMWRRLLGELTPGSADHTAIKQAIDSLDRLPSGG